ncbi:hypothetical protein JCM3774_001729 [Rhodotorula dairenensis]
MPRSTASPLARPSPSSANVATPRHQPASPSRQSRSRAQGHAAVPGIITLPQSKQFDRASSRSSSPARSSRHRTAQPAPAPVPEPTARDKPTELVTAPKTAQTKRRNREKRTDSPLKHATDPADLVPEQDDTSSATTAPDSPTKSTRKRRGGRAARQPSPPMPPTADANLFAAPPPPPSHSRSLPSDRRSAHYNALLNVEDEWDMPVLGADAQQHHHQQDKAAKPKESLSWQQELLRSGSNNLATSRSGNNGSPVSRPRSRGQGPKDLRPAPMSATGRSGRPALTTSHSESFTASSSSLNWQQELLLRTDEVQLVQQVSTTTAVTSLTPARQRRNQIKDSITFGLADLDLVGGEADVFSGSPVAAPASSNRRQQQQQKRSAPQQQHVVVESLGVTPTKAVEPRYAGPTFHNSPAPSALPMPSFMLRRQAETVVAIN